MLREAELFAQAQDVLVEVVGRIRPEHRGIVLPPLFAGDRRLPLTAYVDRLARDDADLPEVLAGRTPADGDAGALLGEDRAAGFERLAAAATAAAASVDDPQAPAATRDGPLGTAEHLLRLTLRRAFAAHDIAMHLGSRACPLTEALARGLHERTEPDAGRLREQGVFGEPFEPLPPDVSWRDRFLICAGRDPHPLDH